MLSIVLGTLDRLDQLQRCINSIRRETRIPHTIYVTDAGSSDGTIEYLRDIASETVKPIFVGELLGQAKAYNDVFWKVTTPFVCWLSDDNEVVNGGLDVACDILKQAPGIGMVGLKTRDVEGPFVDAPYIGGISAAGILNVNQGVLKTPVLHEVGGFSETFRNYGIDPDLTAKVLLAGHSVAYTRSVALRHYRNWSMDKDSPEYADLMAKHERSLRLYRSKYGSLIGRRRHDLSKRLLRRLWFEPRGIGTRLNSDSAVFGGLPRDWHNVLEGSFISVLDPLLRAGKNYHLVQKCPKRLLSNALPADPEEACG